MKKFKLKILIFGNRVSLFLQDEKGLEISKSSWNDRRDLSEKLLLKIDSLLGKNKLTIKNISIVEFDCDSPYFQKSKKITLDENLSSKDRCGFMAWQIGEVTTKILNFCH